MLKAFATRQHRRVTLIFLAVFCLAAIGTVAIGLDSNTPALVLAFVAATALVLGTFATRPSSLLAALNHALQPTGASG